LSAAFTRIDFPEIFLGFVAPVGVDIQSSIKHFRFHFERFGYNVIPIKVTDVFKELVQIVPPAEELVSAPPHLRLERYIKYGNQLREYFEDDQLLAGFSILNIVRERVHLAGAAVSSPDKNVFLLINLSGAMMRFGPRRKK
jgi:hypothetical protein